MHYVVFASMTCMGSWAAKLNRNAKKTPVPIIPNSPLTSEYAPTPFNGLRADRCHQLFEILLILNCTQVIDMTEGGTSSLEIMDFKNVIFKDIICTDSSITHASLLFMPWVLPYTGYYCELFTLSLGTSQESGTKNFLFSIFIVKSTCLNNSLYMFSSEYIPGFSACCFVPNIRKFWGIVFFFSYFPEMKDYFYDLPFLIALASVYKHCLLFWNI